MYNYDIKGTSTFLVRNAIRRHKRVRANARADGIFSSCLSYLCFHKQKHKKMNTLVFPFADAFFRTRGKLVLLHCDNQA